MNFHLGASHQRWLIDVRRELAALSPSPTVAAIEQLSDRLAQEALQLDAPRSAALEDANAPARYRRHLLAGGNELSYSALLISWPAAHRTPIHDHAGLWGIELVLDGALEVEEYATGSDLAAPQLVRQRALMLGVGDAAVFTGRRYAHRCRNLSSTRPALSLHVYGGVLDRYHVFQADPQGRFNARPRHARVDTALGV
jgi:predicted metal-dependent enzyme (double-stranded beta helix superfamily)